MTDVGSLDEPRPKAKKARGRKIAIFVHVPKTAGTTLTHLLRLNEPRGSNHIGNIFKASGGVVSPVPYDRLLRRVHEDRSIRLLYGHTPLGVDAYLPANWSPQYITFLRDPVERALSHY